MQRSTSNSTSWRQGTFDPARFIRWACIGKMVDEPFNFDEERGQHARPSGYPEEEQNGNVSKLIMAWKKYGKARRLDFVDLYQMYKRSEYLLTQDQLTSRERLAMSLLLPWCDEILRRLSHPTLQMIASAALRSTTLKGTHQDVTAGVCGLVKSRGRG